MNSEVSIVIPCYNAEKYIRECIDSCMSQTYPPAKIICVNDGSSDQTLEVLLQIQKELETVQVKNQENQGACAARNSGLIEVQTKYVQFLDADDLLHPSKLESDLELIHKTKAQLLVGSYEKVGLNGGSKQKIKSVPLTLDETWEYLVLGNLGITSCNLFHAEYLKKNKISWDISLKSSQEYKLMFDILKTEPQVAFSSEINTSIIRRDMGSISSKNAEGNVIRWLNLRQEILAFLEETDQPLFKEVRTKTQALLFDRIRLLAKYNLDLAEKLRATMIQKTFTPKVSSNNTRMYVTTYKLLGFKNAERVKKLMGK